MAFFRKRGDFLSKEKDIYNYLKIALRIFGILSRITVKKEKIIRRIDQLLEGLVSINSRTGLRQVFRRKQISEDKTRLLTKLERQSVLLLTQIMRQKKILIGDINISEKEEDLVVQMQNIPLFRGANTDEKALIEELIHRQKEDVINLLDVLNNFLASLRVQEELSKDFELKTRKKGEIGDSAQDFIPKCSDIHEWEKGSLAYCKEVTRRLIEESRRIVRENEIIKKSFDPKELEELYKFWYEDIRNAVVYHGTSSMYVDQIFKFGLDPNTKPFDEVYIFNLTNINKKIDYLLTHGKLQGVTIHYDYSYLERYLETGYAIYLTFNHLQACSYAYNGLQGGETVKKLRGMVTEILGIGQPLLQHLTKSEIQIMRYFYKLISVKTSQSTPVVLHILLLSPPILHALPKWLKTMVISFNGFLEYYKEVKELNPDNHTVQEFDGFKAYLTQNGALKPEDICDAIKKTIQNYQPNVESLFIRAKIAPQFIIKYEHI